MRPFAHILLLLCVTLLAGLGVSAKPVDISPAHPVVGAAGDSTLYSLMIVESRDANGNLLGRGCGIILKKGYVACNYHFVAGAPKVVIVRPGDFKEFPADGYLTVEEKKDLIILSVPGITGPVAKLTLKEQQADGYPVTLVERLSGRQFKYAKAEVKGRKDINEMTFQQVVSKDARDCVSGPVIGQGEIVGFTTAGYYDGKYYAYMVPATELSRIQNRSFIIKDIESLPDSVPTAQSAYQTSLMASLTSILWLPLEDAEQAAKTHKKKVVITIFTDWCGWCAVMNQNTWNKLNIIRYVNENYYAVKMDAETQEVLRFKGASFPYLTNLHSNQLAWSLLNGIMEFPSTVFLDENGNVLTVIPGFMDPGKMEVVLHYFSENAHLKSGTSFQDYEMNYARRKED